MLEFLELEEEAMRVVLGCILIGIPLGAQIGAMTAYAKPVNDKATPGQIAYLVISILVGVIGLFIGGWPAIVLFFTFQWKTLIGALFQGCIVAAVSYFLGRWAILSIRRGKYMRNPVVKEVAQFCRQNDIVGIVCFENHLRFFKTLQDPDYCKRDVHLEKKEDKSQAEAYQAAWTKPDSWTDYNSGYIAALKFADKGYPNVPDLPMFASALAKKLGGFGFAEHDHRVQHDTVRYSGNTKIITHNITVLHRDCFVFSRKARSNAKKEWKRLGLDAKQEKPAPKPNTWE